MKKTNVEYTHDEILSLLKGILRERQILRKSTKIEIEEIDFYRIIDYDKMFSILEKISPEEDILVGSFYEEREFILKAMQDSSDKEYSIAFLPYLAGILLYLFWKTNQELSELYGGSR